MQRRQRLYVQFKKWIGQVGFEMEYNREYKLRADVTRL